MHKIHVCGIATKRPVLVIISFNDNHDILLCTNLVFKLNYFDNTKNTVKVNIDRFDERKASG